MMSNEHLAQLTKETCCVVIDTETNGLFRKRGKNPRMVALAWSIFSVGKGSIRKQSFIVQADDFDPNPSGLLKHGIDRTRALRDGIPVKAILEEFDRDIDFLRLQLLISHNIEFDVQVLTSECQRTGFDLSRALNLPRFCTMKETTSLLAIPRGDRSGEYDRRIEAYIFPLIRQNLTNLGAAEKVLFSTFLPLVDKQEHDEATIFDVSDRWDESQAHLQQADIGNSGVLFWTGLNLSTSISPSTGRGVTIRLWA